ncbi:MAG: hypothetical protein H6658_16310 [Ardenticatenaceae bacterium]|nr:hypothetical protein [Ardenticatenaceae bacterium]
MNEERLRVLIAAAIIDCHDPHEEYWGMMAALEQQLRFPFAAFASGEFVSVVGIDEGHSNERRGIMVTIQKDGDDYSFPLSELQLSSEANEHNAEWIAAYKLWSR